MKRQIVYPGAIPLETDILNTNKNVMIAIGHMLQDMIGTATLFSGLGCVPTSPAGMTVNLNPGRAYSLQATDTGAYSSLSADAHPLMKQGILLDAVNFSCPAPTTAGFSINYLIEGAFQEVDAGSAVLPYYNASNPAQAYSGPNGTGTSNTTFRDNTVQLQLKAGAAATTGSQTTPTPDAGFNGLWVVTVAFGATTITSSNITQYAGAPFMSGPVSSGRLLRTSIYAIVGGVQMVSVNGGAFTATGASIFTPLAQTSAIRASIVGGGGGSGGTAATTSTQCAAAVGGGAGAYAQGWFTAGFTGITITAGAPGTAGVAGNNAGGNGGTSSLGALMSAPGGLGGNGGGAFSNTANAVQVNGLNSPAPTGFNLIGYPGNAASPAWYLTGTGSPTSGGGGSSPLGAGDHQHTQSVGGPGLGYGGGAGGAAASTSTAAQAGGPGASGAAVIEEFA